MIRTALLALLVTCFTTPAIADIKRVDGIAALVNQDIILYSDIDSRLTDLYERYADNLSVLPDESTLKTQLLEQLITESIQLQMANDAGFVVNDTDLNSALAQYAESQSKDLTALANEDPERYQGIRKNIENQILMSQIQRRDVAKRFQINQKEVDTFLNTRKGRAALNTEYRFFYTRFSSEKEALAQKKLLTAGGQLGVDQGATDLGFRTQSKLPSLIQNLDFSRVKPGDSLAIIAANNAWHLFQLTGTQAAKGKVVAQVRARHILLQADAIFTPEQAKALAEKIQGEISLGADFATLAKTYSDDLASRHQGGDLGWSDPENFVPEFTAALSELAVGDVSGVVESPFGWHIIQLLEKRLQDIGEQELRNQVTQSIYQTRFQQELPRWLGEIRENAFIERRI